jgi:predicted nucleic acid-binding protein
MTFDDLPAGASVFVDANPFIYHCTPEPTFGAVCRVLMERIARREVTAVTSAHVLTNVAHRMMTIEAMQRFSWPEAGIASRLNRHHDQIRTLDRHRQAIDDIGKIGVRVTPVTDRLVAAAAIISQQLGLLSGDALVVAVMQDEGLTHLASHDTDFDRIPGITRFGPS